MALQRVEQLEKRYSVDAEKVVVSFEGALKLHETEAQENQIGANACC